jgi:hypothetical protein
MKLKSILSKIKKGEGEVLEKIKVEKYIPFSIKRAIVKNVAMQVTYKDEDLYTEEGELLLEGTEQLIHDLMLQELLTFAYKVSYLTDVVIDGLLDENGIVNIKITEKAYDAMCKAGVYWYINNQFINDDIDSLVNYEVKQELERNNSTANILKILIEDLVSKLPSQEDIGNLMTEIPNQLDGLKNLKILNNKLPKDSEIKEVKDGK